MPLRRLLVPVVLLMAAATALAAHDLFLTMGNYLVPDHAGVKIVALNGTFSTSENSIDRNRVADLALVTPEGRTTLDTSVVSAEGKRTAIQVTTGAPGTYVAALSTRPSEISLTAVEFNTYLRDEGIGQVLAERRRAGELRKPARERYAKHVKVVFQAGDTHTDGWKTVLGYPAELVPLANPYRLHPGDTLRVQVLVNGAPVGEGLEVLAGGRTTTGSRQAPQKLRTDAQGTVALRLPAAGSWYAKFISMTRATEPSVDYVSNWTTLTFGVAPRQDAVLRGGDGREMGRVGMRNMPGGVQLRVRATGLTAGRHGIHLHAVARCEGPAFQSAGGHLNPGGRQHGHRNPAGHHLGDLGNLDAGADGTATAVIVVPGTTVRALLGEAGIALVIHAAPDDEATDPAGNAGARVACAVLD